MKILVCVSQTPDTTAKIDFTNNNTQFNTNNVTYIINPTDEWYALVRAIELKKQHGGTVISITVGGAETEQNIRKALAIGADEAVRVDTPPTDAYQVAAQIADYAKDQGFDLIFTGKETIDYNGASVGGMLAELLDLPYVVLAAKLEMPDATTARVTCEGEGSEEIVEVKTPFVVSAQKGMAEQVIPNMQGIMMARRKPLTVRPAANVQSLTSINVYEPMAQRKQVRMIDPEHPEELVRLLHEEAKVI